MLVYVKIISFFSVFFLFPLLNNQLLEEDHLLVINDSTFINSFGTPNNQENPIAMVETPGGDFIIGGSRNDESVLLMVDSDGVLLWQRSLNFLPSQESIYDLYIDSENYLIGNGRINPNGNNTNFFFKYDYENDNLIWTRTFPQPYESRIHGLVEIPNGNYVFNGRVQPVNACDATLIEVDRNTGELVNLNAYNLGHCELIVKSHIHNNHIYSVGRYTLQGSGGNLERFRGVLSKFDFEGNEIWTRVYTEPPSQMARTYMTSIIEKDGEIYTLGRGDLSGTEPAKVPIFLFNINADDGQLKWAKKYDIPQSSSTGPRNLIATEDGFFLVGSCWIYDDIDHFLLKLDKQGDIIWSKIISLPGTQITPFILQGDHFFFTSSITDQNGTDLNIGFAKLNLDGTLDNDSCNIVQEFQVQVSDYSDSYDGTVSLDHFTLNNSLFSEIVLSENIQLNTEIICSPGPLEEDCDNLIDDDENGLTDCEDPVCACMGSCLLFTSNNPLGLPESIEIEPNEVFELPIDLDNQDLIDSIFWHPDSIVDCQNCLDPSISVSEPTLLQYSILDINGCTYSYELEINIIQNCDSDFLLPNAFTPDNDGINDVFEVPDQASDWEVLSIFIFNRWGQEVFSSSESDFAWDGRTNGETSANEVYVYLIRAKCGNQTKVFKGDLTLLR